MLILDRLVADQAAALLPELIDLLRDAVDQGASVGFLPPLDPGDARAYWAGVFEQLETGGRIALVARLDGRLVGSVQLDLPAKPNASHRAEVQKLLVHTAARRQGIGRALMDAIEEAARAERRSLLVLDTRQGDAAERLYRQRGYREAGIIPGYARSADGTLDGSVFFYRDLNLPQTGAPDGPSH